jgi:hypothetical protein
MSQVATGWLDRFSDYFCEASGVDQQGLSSRETARHPDIRHADLADNVSDRADARSEVGGERQPDPARGLLDPHGDLQQPQRPRPSGRLRHAQAGALGGVVSPGSSMAMAKCERR